MPTLKDLLVHAMTTRDVSSGRALARLANDHGLTVSYTQINGILNGSYKSQPSRQLLQAIGWLAGEADMTKVYEAAGLVLPGRPFAEELPPNVDHLRPHHRRAVVEVIRGFLVDVERDQLWEQVGGLMSDTEVDLFVSADDAVAGLERVLEHRGGLTAEEIAGSGLPTMAEAREARRLRDLEDAQLQDQAAYDDEE